MWGAQEKSGGTSKNFRPALRAGIVPPTCKLLPTPLPNTLTGPCEWNCHAKTTDALCYTTCIANDLLIENFFQTMCFW